ncbi:YifB family Mg chelatase-like AAA ATPase [Cerasicoccus frondis]|uniref:YifB family Mg chelatase-like AAA ATPase n=1 Tax=Cerasicoccus frondis TaxID=490090 RepID=UPI0028527EA0|nr:YifB family Mg chelatase-like AAA ATPase [Cerasicoccus frondis]
MLATIHSGALLGIDAHPVQVEVNAGEHGDPKVFMVGLPDSAVKESIDRVRSALSNTGFKNPETRTTINLAPGDIRKEGPLYDLPIALGMLGATRQIGDEKLAGVLDQYIIAGELSLSGGVRPIRGGLALAMLARQTGKRGVILPPESAEEASLVEDVEVIPIRSLDEAVRLIEGELSVQPLDSQQSPFRQPPDAAHWIDFSEVKGQHTVRRAVEIAVAGGHNLLLVGPPGSGKSMIAKRIPTIMPEPSLDEYLEILAVQSAAGVSLKDENRCFARPFRSPHHTISDVGLIGGGANPGPGEISLAHHGVLFLDEMPEFKRSTLEVLRQPLEDGDVTISRSAGKVTLPAALMLVAAMNPCPCGYLGDNRHECRCNPTTIQRYRSRISGPLLDRIDLHVEAPALTFEELRSAQKGESSEVMRERVMEARALQSRRFLSDKNGSRLTACNARMSHRQIRQHCAINREQGDLLQQAMEELKLSARAYDRILKVARTIADLAGAASIDTVHLLEAIQYRSLDRRLFY